MNKKKVIINLERIGLIIFIIFFLLCVMVFINIESENIRNKTFEIKKYNFPYLNVTNITEQINNIPLTKP